MRRADRGRSKRNVTFLFFFLPLPSFLSSHNITTHARAQTPSYTHVHNARAYAHVYKTAFTLILTITRHTFLFFSEIFSLTYQIDHKWTHYKKPLHSIGVDARSSMFPVISLCVFSLFQRQIGASTCQHRGNLLLSVATIQF